MADEFPTDPISCIEWRRADELDANDYNPNVVFTPELRLLEKSILKTGWVQPILINPEGTIIDGFHRATLARTSEAIRQRYGGRCPCAIIRCGRAAAMLMTVRMNRAKGSHVAVRMSALVRELIDEHQLDPQEIADEMGATLDEVELLRQEGVFKHRNLDKAPFSRAWVPEEDGRRVRRRKL